MQSSSRLLYQYWYKSSFFLFELSSCRCSHVSALFTSEGQRKTDLWHLWYFCHTFRPCLWHHWYRLLHTTWQRSCLQFLWHHWWWYRLLDTRWQRYCLPCLWHHRHNLLGATWQHLQSCFYCFQINNQDMKSSKKTTVCPVLIPLLLIQPVMLLHFGFSFNSCSTLVTLWQLFHFPFDECSTSLTL